MTSRNFWRTIGNIIVSLVLVITLQRSDFDMTDPVEQARAYTRWIEFDYVTWISNSLALKVSFGSLDLPNYLDEEGQRQAIFEYLRVLDQWYQVDASITEIYANPDIQNPQSAADDLEKEAAGLKFRLDRQQPIAEAVIQHQVSVVAGEMGLGLGRQLVPPLLYHTTPLPLALIVSPRSEIKQIADISLEPDLTLNEIIQVEDSAAKGLNVSTLVVPVGGVGVYPTMVSQTTNLNWLVETIAHEWTHNYLTLHPAGMLYLSSPEMRTINETTASIAGAEIGAEVIARYYPEFAPPPPTEPPPGEQPAEPSEPVFDYRAEMHETRVTTDRLLAEGKIETAEAYMEARRKFFWDYGYQIRKLNQAYFAFYGAYADQPGGAAGEDPVGEAVRSLREQSTDLAGFMRQVAWVTSYEGLQRRIESD